MAPWTKLFSVAPVRGLGMPHPLALLRPRLRVARVRLALAHTFPSLSAPAHALHASAPAHAPHFATRVARAPPTFGPRFAAARPRAPPPGSSRNVAHVGLGTARGFASAPAAQLPANVPVVLRAFAGYADDDRRRPRARAGRFGLRRLKEHPRRVRACSIASVDWARATPAATLDATAIEDTAVGLAHYFPLPAVGADPALLEPERLVTAGATATLAIPLAPDLSNLLAPLSIPYVDAALGAATLARLTHGVLPLHAAFSVHGAHRVYPLLHKLDALGVLTTERARARLEAAVDADGNADILRVVFDGRGAADVRAILGESLQDDEEGTWWVLSERRDGVCISREAAHAIQDDWAEPPPVPGPASAYALGQTRLVMPAPNADADSGTPEESYSWPSPASWASGMSTPLSLDSPVSGLSSPASSHSPSALGDSLASLSDEAFESALSATLARVARSPRATSVRSWSSASSDGAIADADADDGLDAHWLVPPSEADADVELSDADMGASVWSDAGAVEAALGPAEMDASWTGSGAGFGFAQW
ncbi:hypothetical protein Q5752_005579 [Cryptotrichosporon argae]